MSVSQTVFSGNYFIKQSLVSFIHLRMASNERKHSVSGPARPPSKKKRFLCKFKPEWAAEAAWLLPSSIDKEHAFCKVCNKKFLVQGLG